MMRTGLGKVRSPIVLKHKTQKNTQKNTEHKAQKHRTQITYNYDDDRLGKVRPANVQKHKYKHKTKTQTQTQTQNTNRNGAHL